MASNQTKNFGLNQWQPGDSVVREEFNQDNVKIDAALGAMPYVRIASMTSTAATNQLEMDVSHIDFTKYLRVDLFFLCAKPISTSVHLGLNRLSTGHCMCGSGSASVDDGRALSTYLGEFLNAGRNNGWVSFMPPLVGAQVACVFHSCQVTLRGGTWINYASASRTVMWENLTSFDFNCSTDIPAGSEVILCGIRK